MFGLEQALKDIDGETSFVSNIYTEPHIDDNSNSQVHIGDLSSFLSNNAPVRDIH